MKVHSPWGQVLPRSIGLPPAGDVASAALLRLLLRRGSPIDLIYNGFALEPRIANESIVRVDPRARPRPGAFMLCEREGWCDLLRVLRVPPSGGIVAGLDTHPAGRARIAPDRLLGAVVSPSPPPPLAGLVAARTYPLWSRGAALRHAWRKILQVPDFGDGAARSVREKYAQQIRSYESMVHVPMNETAGSLLRSAIPPGGSVLIAGCGAGGEMVQLARAGYRVTGFDVLASMVEASRRSAASSGVSIEVFRADMSALDLAPRRFDAAFITPLVYSFIPGRARRIGALHRLGRHLEPGGTIVFSAALVDGPARLLQVAVPWALRRARGSSAEFGDWYTRFMTPRGPIGLSFSHLFFAGQVRREAREAGFRCVRRRGRGHFMATGF